MEYGHKQPEVSGANAASITHGKAETVGKILTIRGLALGHGIPKICVPVAETTRPAILAAARRVQTSKAQLLEWRADYWEEAGEPERVAKLLQDIRREIGSLPLLFTYRTRAEGGSSVREESPQEYLRLNRAVIQSGQADLIDVELRVGQEVLETLCEEAHAAGQYILASSHDFTKTPSEEELARCFRQMEEGGADVLKVAVMPQSAEDVLRLMAVGRAAYRRASRPVVAISMGGLGLESRICGELSGSAMTFGCLDKASAPGQMDVEELAQVLRTLHAARGGGK